MTIVRAQQSITNPTSTRMYICVVDAIGLAIHVLALSSVEATHAGTLEWPTLSVSGMSHAPLRCVDHVHMQAVVDLCLCYFLFSRLHPHIVWHASQILACVVVRSGDRVHTLGTAAARIGPMLTGVADWDAWPCFRLSCRPDDIRFTVYDNLLLLHCLPLKSTTFYDLALPPTIPPGSPSLSTFLPVHTALWTTPGEDCVHQGSAVAIASETSLHADHADPPLASPEVDAAQEGVAADSEKLREAVQGHLSEDKKDREGSSAGLCVIDPGQGFGTASTSCHGIPAAATFLPPCHVIDLESRTHFKMAVNLKLVLGNSYLDALQLFRCLCERDRVRLWPWLRKMQIAALQQYCMGMPPLLEVRRLFDEMLARCITLTGYVPRSCHLSSLELV
jgi:hypothetical protein